jgi:hypothetical protein
MLTDAFEFKSIDLAELNNMLSLLELNTNLPEDNIICLLLHPSGIYSIVVTSSIIILTLVSFFILYLFLLFLFIQVI